jgi:peptide/nickel transport system permease protein
MLNYCLRRLAVGFGMLIALSMLIFVLLRLAPGDPIDAYINPNVAMSQADMDAVRSRLGLDQPLPLQYLAWLGSALRGDLGFSLQRNGETVLGLVAERIGPTLLLMGTGLVIAIVVGIGTGILGAVRRNSATDVGLSVAAFFGISSPAFLTALVGLYVFSVLFRWAPSGGMLTPGAPFSMGDLLGHLILPAILLSIGHAALIMRYMRASLLEVLNQDYVRSARAKGVREVWVILKHALRNALLPVVTTIGLQAGLLFAGAVLTETVFAFNGIGQYLFEAIGRRDYPVLQGFILFIAIVYSLINLVVDVSYGVIDPRVRAG